MDASAAAADLALALGKFTVEYLVSFWTAADLGVPAVDLRVPVHRPDDESVKHGARLFGGLDARSVVVVEQHDFPDRRTAEDLYLLRGERRSILRNRCVTRLENTDTVRRAFHQDNGSFPRHIA